MASEKQLEDETKNSIDGLCHYIEFVVKKYLCPNLGISDEYLLDEKHFTLDSHTEVYGPIKATVFATSFSINYIINFATGGSDYISYRVELPQNYGINDRDTALSYQIFCAFVDLSRTNPDLFNQLIQFNPDKYSPLLSEQLDLFYKNALFKAVGGNDIPAFPSLMFCLESLSLDMYEGENISFSCLISDEDNSSRDSFNYLAFLSKDHYSSVMTDENTCGVKLDKNGNLISYVEYDKEILKENGYYNVKDTNNLVLGCPDSDKWLCFCAVSYKHKNESKGYYQLGVSLRENGDILVFKSRQLRLARINGKWKIMCNYYFNKNVYDLFAGGETSNPLADYKSHVLYSTILDVSFMRTGGCIAIVDRNKFFKEINEIDHPIMKKRDLLFDNDDIDKTTKRYKLKELILKDAKNKDKSHNLFDISEGLRAQLVSLDGATIIDTNGNIIATSTIVNVKGGKDSGGGRSASAEELSRFGLAIKISMDGSVKVYKGKKNIISFL